MRFNTLVPSTELSSEQYHGLGGTFSSSQLKTMLEDPEIFYKKYITHEIPREDNPAFAVGTYFHTAVLEPEKLAEETAIFLGATRRGAAWEEFKELHKGKAIINKTEKETAERMVKAVNESPISMGFINTSTPEVSAFIEVYVLGKEVFTFKDGVCYCLLLTGWTPTSLDFDEDDIKDFGVKLVLKVRADSLGKGTGTISDLKSTSGNVKKAHEMQSKIGSYNYDLSAALYLDIFTLVSGETYDKFVWIFASKDKETPSAMSWVASDKNIMVGRAKWRKAVVLIAKYMATNWTFQDELGVLEPAHYLMDWLQEA